MQAIQVEKPGGPEGLRLVEMPSPEPGPGEVRVRVAAAGVNRADVLQRLGNYPAPPGASPILGLEIAGTLLDPAPGFPVGSSVMALVSGGGYATEAVVPVGQLLAVPEGLSPEEAASLPEACLTAYHNLFDVGRLQPGEWTLIHAAGSGVGTASVQIASFTGARVIATSRTPDKLDRILELGAAEAIEVRGSQFGDRVLELTEGRGVNLILDFVGAPYWSENVRSLAVRGRMALIGTLGGAQTPVDLGVFLRKRLLVAGSTLRGQSVEEKAKLTERASTLVQEAVQLGRLRPVLDRVFALRDAAEAHRYMESNVGFGKIVLSTGSGWRA